ncbi:MAG: hypothetical protein ABIL58_09390 [Pseudomonadota bacterium]
MKNIIAVIFTALSFWSAASLGAADFDHSHAQWNALLGSRGITSLKQFFALHAEHLAESPEDRRFIREQRAAISFTPYDWRLNVRP